MTSAICIPKQLSHTKLYIYIHIIYTLRFVVSFSDIFVGVIKNTALKWHEMFAYTPLHRILSYSYAQMYNNFHHKLKKKSFFIFFLLFTCYNLYIYIVKQTFNRVFDQKQHRPRFSSRHGLRNINLFLVSFRIEFGYITVHVGTDELYLYILFILPIQKYSE